jgi:hypothetical protein
MLSTARTAFYSAVWNQGGNLVASATAMVTAVADTINNLFVRPSRYADFSPVTLSPTFFGDGLFIFSSSTDPSIDMTDLGTVAQKTMSALTFRVGTDWLTTAPSEGFFTGFAVFDQYVTATDTIFLGLSVNVADGQYLMGGGNGPNCQFDSAQMDQLRNRWLTLIVCTSNTSDDFGNWTGGDDFGETGQAYRTQVYDVDTGDLVQSQDGWAFGPPGIVDLEAEWTLGFESSGEWYQHFINLGQDGYDTQQVQFLSYQHALGSTVDPQIHGRDLMGSGFNTAVEGIQPWMAWNFNSAGTAISGSYGDRGYQHPFDPACRMPPGGVEITCAFDKDPATPPVFTSL